MNIHQYINQNKKYLTSYLIQKFNITQPYQYNWALNYGYNRALRRFNFGVTIQELILQVNNDEYLYNMAISDGVIIP